MNLVAASPAAVASLLPVLSAATVSSLEAPLEAKVSLLHTAGS